MNPLPPGELLDQLRKLLRLERSGGFRDRAAVGGTERFVAKWAERVLSQSLRDDSARVARVGESFRGYGLMATNDRRRVVDGALAMLDDWSQPWKVGSVTVASVHGGDTKPPLVAKTNRSSVVRTNGRESSSVSATGLSELPVTSLPGVGSHYAKVLARLGIASLNDLLRFPPRSWQDRTRILPIRTAPTGEPVTVRGRVVQSIEDGPPRRRWADILLHDASGDLRVIFFGQPYQARRFRPNDALLATGVILFDSARGERRMHNPDIEALDPRDETGRTPVAAVYPLTEDLTQGRMRQFVRSALDVVGRRVVDWLPASIREDASLPHLSEAFERLHRPVRRGEESTGLDRIAFDQVFLLELAVAARRAQRVTQPGIPMRLDMPSEQNFRASLPFSLTAAQERVVAEIENDLSAGRPMNRLLQGDVGAGKTVVAAAACAVCCGSGWQTAVMAPTEILAQQHRETFARLLSGAGIDVLLLTAHVRSQERVRVKDLLATGRPAVVVGTHALLERGADFPKLGLVVVDEQHRFGVQQRALLQAKGVSPHVLVMSATPIPRTLAMTVYGDLDVSALDQMPPGRTPVETRVLTSSDSDRAALVTRIRLEISEGRQAYVVCPAIDPTPRAELKAATAVLSRWRDLLPTARVELVHGRQRSVERERVMTAFREGKVDVLVSTTVVEVGVDVSNATAMVVENAERFGLSTLHQLRGRVGRGSQRSVCFLMTGVASERSLARLGILAETQDGFRVAEKDLLLRGPGELFGTLQHGEEPFPDFPEAFSRGFDTRIVAPARRIAFALLERDPTLSAPEHADIRTLFLRRYGSVLALSSVA